MSEPNRPSESQTLARHARNGARLIVSGLMLLGRAVSGLVWMWLKRFGGVVFALIVLFEQWGWRPLLALLSPLARLAPIAALERWISNLPPYGALVAFGVPSAFLLPLKLLALYLIAHGHALMAGALFVAAKIVGTAVVARLYQLTERQLMQIGWFRVLHDAIVPRLHALHDEIRSSWAWRYGRMLKTRAKHKLAPLMQRLKQQWFGGRL